MSGKTAISKPSGAEALGFFVGLACVVVAAWHVELALRRRARAKRDREWYKRPPK